MPPDTDFMDDLLSGLDDSFFNAAPSLSPSPRKGNAAASDLDITGLTDGAENWDWDDMESDFLTCTRCVVEEVSEIQVHVRWGKVSHTHEPPCTVCQAVSDCRLWSCTSMARMNVDLSHCSMIGQWQTCESVRPPCSFNLTSVNRQAGDVVNILGHFSPTSSNSPASIGFSIEVSSKNNALIHHPDNLITVTAISNALQCRRKPLLSGLVRSSSDTTPALNWGNMIHEVMQTCLASERWEDSWIQRCIEDVIARSLPVLVKIGVGIEEARRELELRAKGLRTFARRYISDMPKVCGLFWLSLPDP